MCTKFLKKPKIEKTAKGLTKYNFLRTTKSKILLTKFSSCQLLNFSKNRILMQALYKKLNIQTIQNSDNV